MIDNSMEFYRYPQVSVLPIIVDILNNFTIFAVQCV